MDFETVGVSTAASDLVSDNMARQTAYLGRHWLFCMEYYARLSLSIFAIPKSSYMFRYRERLCQIIHLSHVYWVLAADLVKFILGCKKSKLLRGIIWRLRWIFCGSTQPWW